MKENPFLPPVLDAIPIPVFVLDMNCRIRFWNKSASNYFGMNADAVAGTDRYRALLSEERVAEIESIAGKRKDYCYGTDFIRANEDGRWFNFSARAITDPKGDRSGIVITLEDVTHLKKIEELLKENTRSSLEKCLSDDLTGFFNVHFFMDRLKSEIDRSNRYGDSLSLISIDLNDFKSFKEANGEVEGEKILRGFAEGVRSHLRKTDIACRCSEAEFSIILPHTTGRKAVHAAERIRNIFVPESETTPRPRISLGVAQLVFGEGLESFLRRADENLFTAREKGEDQVVFAVDSFA